MIEHSLRATYLLGSGEVFVILLCSNDVAAGDGRVGSSLELVPPASETGPRMEPGDDWEPMTFLI